VKLQPKRSVLSLIHTGDRRRSDKTVEFRRVRRRRSAVWTEITTSQDRCRRKISRPNMFRTFEDWFRHQFTPRRTRRRDDLVALRRVAWRVVGVKWWLLLLLLLLLLKTTVF